MTSFLLAMTQVLLASVHDPILTRDLHFTNRAKCALESKRPADNVLVLLSNMEVGRSLYRVGQIRNEASVDSFVQLGLNKYRYTVLSLLDLIHKKLVKNELPLLSTETNNQNTDYAKISKLCFGKSRCREMDDYIESLWKDSKNPIQGSDKKNLKDLTLRCVYLKKFTPLEGHLFGTVPTSDILKQIANAANNISDYYADCHDFSSQENQKISTYEFNLESRDDKGFDIVGFDYWNSIKIYFSWAFRFSKEAIQLGYPFDEIFHSLLIEESLFMLPNGCKSVENPKCDSSTINQNSLRLFAKHDYKKTAQDLDFFRAIPEGASQQMLNDPFSAVNQDILDTGKFETSDAWAENFRKNFSDTRFTMRRKFLLSVTNLSLISKNIDEKKLSNSFNRYFADIDTGKASEELKADYFYLCGEHAFFDGTEVSLLKSKINILKEFNLSDELTGTVNVNSISELTRYYETLSKVMSDFCGRYDSDKVLGKGFQIDQTGFSSWYTDFVYKGKVVSVRNLLRKEKLSFKKPFLAYKVFEISKDLKDVVCIDSVDCARIAIQSMVDISSVIQYAELFLDIENEINSGNVFNPYSERVACGAYDPWFKTKSSLFAFGTDVIQAGIAAATPGIVYGQFDLQSGTVTSFRQLVKDGKLIIDPKYDRAKVISAIAVDLGSMSSVPCSLSITRSKEFDPSKLLSFRGLTLRTCKEDEKNVVNVEVNSQDPDTKKSYTNGCVQCSLDFEHISSVISNTIPFGRTTFFMVRGIYRLYKGMSDPVNVPRSWSVNPYLVQASYHSFGKEIPEECVKKLSSGKPCMKTLCEENIVKGYLQRGVILKELDVSEVWSGRVKVKFKGCDKETIVKVHSSGDSMNENFCSLGRKAPLTCGVSQ